MAYGLQSGRRGWLAVHRDATFMVSREKILHTLRGLTDHSVARSHRGLMESTLRAALALAECDAAAVVCAVGRRVERMSLVGGGEPVVDPSPVAIAEVVRPTLRDGMPVSTPDLAADRRFGEDDACPGLVAGPALWVPLRARDHAPGFLAVYRTRGGARFRPQEVTTLMLLAAWSGLALENARLGESLGKLAVTDDLTQVYNYRFLKTALRREIKRAGRFGQDLALLMIDVDNLKAYNDRNGHLRGSYLLKEIAADIVECVRSFDLVAKYGGDEFTVILPQTDREGARVVAERVRSRIAGRAYPLAPAGSITVSLGVGIFPQDAGDGAGLIQAADRALYLAKQLGRNRVESLDSRAA